MSKRFQARQCPSCQLRFPVEEGSPLGASCPSCGARTRLEEGSWTTLPATAREACGPRLALLLDNLRSTRNVGSIFRSADGAGVEHIDLCGFCPRGDHPKLQKTALGAQEAVPWSHSADALTRARERAGQGWQLWALEGGAGAESLLESQVLGQDQKILLIVGHEVSGVDARLLDLAERRVFLPMAGVKGSLNVGVATAIAAYAIRRQLREKLSRSSSPPES